MFQAPSAILGVQAIHVGIVLAPGSKQVVLVIIGVSGIGITRGIAVPNLDHRVHGVGDVGIESKLKSWKTADSLHEVAGVAHVVERSEIDGGCIGRLHLVVVAQQQGVGTRDFGLSKLYSRKSVDGMLAEGVGIIALSTSRPIAALRVAGLQEATCAAHGIRHQARHVVQRGVGVFQHAHGMAPFVGIGLCLHVVRLIYQLRIECKPLDNLEEQIAMIT